MSFYTTVNEEALRIPISDASTGPEIGFMEGVRRAWQFGSLYEAQFGVRMDLVYQERENAQKILRAGGKAPDTAFPLIGGGFEPQNVEAMVKAMNRGDEAGYRAVVGDRDKEITALQLRFPDAGIKTYGQMYQDMQGRYQKMKAGLEREYSGLGTLGWIVGEVATGVRPDVNPLSALTTPIGGAGKTITGRVAVQGGAQAAIQAVEEVTGIRANKRLLLEDPTAAESFANIALAGGGGAGLQALGELGYVAIKGASRRWFKSAPKDPAPVPPPVEAPVAPSVYKAPVLQDMPPLSAEANMRLTKAVQDTAGTGSSTMRTARADFEFVAREIESWTGPQPWELPPNTMSRAFYPGEDVNVKSRVTAQSAGETVDELARRLDPDTFRVYDKLAADKKLARDQVETALASRNIDVEKELSPMREKIAELEDKLEDANKRKTKIYNKDLQELRGQLAVREAELIGADTNTAAIYRRQVMHADEQMRDMSPAVSRAYARAQGKWDLMEGQRSQIDAMMNKGETTLDAVGPPREKKSKTFTEDEAFELGFFDGPAVKVKGEVFVTRFNSGSDSTHGDAVDNAVAKYGEDAVNKAMEDGNFGWVYGKDDTFVRSDQVIVASELTRVPLHEKVPELSTQRSTRKPGEDAADTVKRVHQEEVKLEETAADTFTARIPKALEEGDVKLDIDGVEHAVKLDERITIEGDDGMPRSVTIREMLQEVHEYDEVLKAVNVCSVGPISATV